MKKAMVFTCDEFENLIYEITYETVGLWMEYNDWGLAELSIEDEEYDKWLSKFGEEIEEKVNSFEDVYELVYAMLDEKYNEKVDSIILDESMDTVAVIFK